MPWIILFISSSYVYNSHLYHGPTKKTAWFYPVPDLSVSSSHKNLFSRQSLPLCQLTASLLPTHMLTWVTCRDYFSLSLHFLDHTSLSCCCKHSSPLYPVSSAFCSVLNFCLWAVPVVLKVLFSARNATWDSCMPDMLCSSLNTSF